MVSAPRPTGTLRTWRTFGVPRLPSSPVVRRARAFSRTGVPEGLRSVCLVTLLGERALPRLLEEVFQLALLLLSGTLVLVRAPLGLLGLVAGYGAGGFLDPALGLVHGPF